MNTEFLAWWGAIVSTIVAIFQIVSQMRSGPRLRLTAKPGMEQIPNNFSQAGKFIVVSVTNIGTLNTTINHVCVFGYESWLSKIIGRKCRTQVWIIDQLPRPLAVGDQWSAGLDQSKLDLNYFEGCKLMYAGVTEARTSKPKLARIDLQAHQTKQSA